MVGAVRPTGSHAPQVGSKGNHGKQKEGTRDFKPQYAAYPAKRAKKAPHAFGYSAATLRKYLPRRPHGGAIRPNRRISNRLRLRGRRGLRRFSEALANHTACNPNPNA